MKKIWKTFTLVLNKKLRVVVMDALSFKEKLRFQISGFQFFSVIFVLVFILFTIAYLTLSYTPLSILLPEKLATSNRSDYEALYLSSLEKDKRIHQQAQFIENMQKVILGEYAIDSVFMIEDIDPTSFQIEDTDVSEAELVIAESVAARVAESTSPKDINTNLFLLDPVKGRVRQKFHAIRHPGIDIVTKKDEVIKACLGGVVVFAAYTDLDGWVTIVKHPNEVTSVYKHAESLFVSAGDFVKTGAPIGIVGSSGEQSTGPHLHFELWGINGPLDPLDYLSFR
ncbi:MAG: M23 family metallopeptidase [Crocinitomicaceae bacterium]|nr:M23 family metallopeptidase [Crocinitomicaceae bacterium]